MIHKVLLSAKYTSNNGNNNVCSLYHFNLKLSFQSFKKKNANILLHVLTPLFQQRACGHTKKQTQFMASPQCLGYKNYKVMPDNLCYPPTSEVLRYVK